MRHPGFLQSFSVSRVFLAALLLYLTSAEQDSNGEYQPQRSRWQGRAQSGLVVMEWRVGKEEEEYT
nr:unnamed protein product [Callosobruchus analis]